MNKADLKAEFSKIFQQEADATFFSPGRINLIGEHTDYNGGHVFPCAITLGTYGAARKRDDQTLRFYSANFADQGIVEVPLADLHFDKADGWTNYLKGMIHFLKEAGYTIDKGMDIYLNGNIPNGSGLSSSASIEMLMGVIAQELFDLDIERLEIVKIGMKTENDFIGVNSGIMDQFAVGMGAANRAILLDTNTLDYELVPLDLKDNVIVIMNTNKRRELADSKYNERRGECEQALAELQTKLDIQSLGQLDAQTFDEYSYLIADENRLKRARPHARTHPRTIRSPWPPRKSVPCHNNQSPTLSPTADQSHGLHFQIAGLSSILFYHS